MSAQEIYLGDSGRLYHEGKRGIPERALPWVARARAAKFAPLIKPTDVVFEYGVGSGWNLAYLQCKAKIGCDISDFLAPAVVEHGIKFLQDSKLQPAESVDVVLCHHVLEHVLNPAETLAEARRILKPGGKLLLYVPYEREMRYQTYDPNEPNHHLFSWNVQTLAALVRTGQFDVKHAGIGRYGYDRFAAHWATKLKLCEFGFRSIRATAQTLRPCLEVRVHGTKSR